MAEFGEQRTYRWAVERARELLSDRNPERYRWLDEELLRFVAQGIEALASVRPASRYLGTRLVRRAYPDIPDAPVPNPDSADYEAQKTAYENAINDFANSPLLVDPQWHDALVEFACYKAYTMDQADAGNLAIAEKHYKKFLEDAAR